MSFAIGLSGLNAANSELSVTSNNIANVGTAGFKGSRAEFADVYAVNQFSTSKTAIGAGVLLSKVGQQFSQGSLEYTDNGLDLAVNGQGFFATTVTRNNANDFAYTRAGAFSVDAEGFVVNAQGRYLQVFPVNANGTVTATSASSAIPLSVPDSSGPPTPTSAASIGANLPAGATSLPIASFNPSDPNTYTNTTSMSVFDSLGVTHTLQTYFIKTAPNTWETRSYVDGSRIAPAGAPAAATTTSPNEILTFNSSGVFQTPAGGLVDHAALTLSNGAAPLDITVDFTPGAGTEHTTQFSSGFLLSSLQQNGVSTGRLSGLEVTEDGVVRASYTNGTATALGKVMMADFSNPQGLRQLGNTMWQETTASGQVIVGEAASGRFGSIQAGALETSNVELTNQLVKLITAQRNFQASAKSIETSNTVTQTVINI